MTPTKEDWQREAPLDGPLYNHVSYYSVRKLYPVVNEFLDDLIDGKIPEPWASECWLVWNRDDINMRRLERLMDRFEKAVDRMAV